MTNVRNPWGGAPFCRSKPGIGKIQTLVAKLGQLTIKATTIQLRELEVPSASGFRQLIKILEGSIENIRVGVKAWHLLKVLRFFDSAGLPNVL
jgi:hypothetical protein